MSKAGCSESDDSMEQQANKDGGLALFHQPAHFG